MSAILSQTQARLVSTELNEIQPAEYRADAVIVLLDGDTPVRVIIVEVQLAPDPGKRFSWPAYVTIARVSHRCPADLLVVAPDSGSPDGARSRSSSASRASSYARRFCGPPWCRW